MNPFSLVALLIILGLVIFIHEFGHFVLAKKNGVDPSAIKDDAAEWQNIPTKIEMDALLSLDLKTDEFKPQKGEKQ